MPNVNAAIQEPIQPAVVPNEPAMEFLARAHPQWHEANHRLAVNRVLSAPVAIQVTHTGEAKYGRLEISDLNAHTHFFGKPMRSVFENLKEKRGITLEHPELPLIKVKQDALFPVELVKMIAFEEGVKLREEQKAAQSARSKAQLLAQNPGSSTSKSGEIESLRKELRRVLNASYDQAKKFREDAQAQLKEAKKRVEEAEKNLVEAEEAERNVYNELEQLD